MKKSFKLLLAATTISVTAASLLSASCDTNESEKRKIINNLVDNPEKDLNKNINSKPEPKNEPHKPNDDGKKADDNKKENDSESSSNETTEKDEKVDKTKDKNSEDQKNKDKDSPGSPKDEKDRKDEKNENESRSDNRSVTPSPETETPPSTLPVPALKPEPQPDMPPADEPRAEGETEGKKELSELDKIAKDLKDIFKFAASSEDNEELKKFKNNSGDYSLWYSNKDRSIWITEGKESPFDNNKTEGIKFVLFELDEKASSIKNDIQLVNDKDSLIKSKEDGYDISTLSNQLNFEILNGGGSNKFSLKVKYKVGKFLNRSESEASDVSNESTVSITIQTK
ncbi:hypothetical protein [Mycoplasmopsis agalactiae]|uniref:hypothetical protein n=1 Tax=Mycoplasmopsis agalactiae TaxID=2110 RepID=UPI001455F22A|nr:hypothetical protein [Mycoplasmopsis agalactiae]MCE6057120.1 hypothetical protein [Mycoplasmopsis agalactiae]MCE6078907.1 hypothetical protein [Mycoplasmopsis agalactiae]MCE6095292.1 hypothetical protein [Mycoplasmopsis agalactiae]MCE6114547.1 hypothetical protein [Mycoplasmopsis agalactiae]NLS34384.1 hypothetical protein [Mycoplasmopsis agalactiae]